MICYFCDMSRESIFGYYCSSCTKLKRTISLYGDRVYEIVEEVLIRKPAQQGNKIKQELKKEILEKTKEYDLRSKSKVELKH